jgi:hypothetical protein
MGWGFDLNEIISIGSTIWAKPWGDGFSYHEITWKGSALLIDQIFDACLKVNGNENDATRTPDPLIKIPNLPLNMSFDDPASFDYREKLVPPSSIGNCLPRPAEKTRRAVF